MQSVTGAAVDACHDLPALATSCGAVPSPSVTPPHGISFEQLYNRWFVQVSRWVIGLGARYSDHEDLVQEVFAVAYRRLAQFDGSNVAGWLFQIARRKVRDHRESSWVQLVLASDTTAFIEAARHTAPGPLDELETKQKSQLLERRLAKLPSEQRAVFTLFELEGFSGHEIAQQQQVPLNTVWVRLYTARRKLKCRPRAPERRSRASWAKGRGQ